MSKKNAALTLAGLSVATVASAFVVNPNLGWFLNQDLSTFMGIGQQVGSALATAFGSSWFELIGIVLFIA